jgi:hypothetical protein
VLAHFRGFFLFSFFNQVSTVFVLAPCVCVCTYRHTKHICKHTYIHTHMCVCVHTDRPNIYVNIHTHTPTFCIVRHPYNIQPYVRTYINTHTHTQQERHTQLKTARSTHLVLALLLRLIFYFFFLGEKLIYLQHLLKWLKDM